MTPAARRQLDARRVGECNICLRERQLDRVVAYGIETYACDECLGNALGEDEE